MKKDKKALLYILLIVIAIVLFKDKLGIGNMAIIESGIVPNTMYKVYNHLGSDISYVSHICPMNTNVPLGQWTSGADVADLTLLEIYIARQTTDFSGMTTFTMYSDSAMTQPVCSANIDSGEMTVGNWHPSTNSRRLVPFESCTVSPSTTYYLGGMTAQECEYMGIATLADNTLAFNLYSTKPEGYCAPDCSCAANIYTNQTCSDGCNGTCTGTMSIPCVISTWSPLASDVCSNETFVQTSNCGTNQTTPGTKNCTVVASCTSNCSCAANIYTNQTCSDGCGGTCTGTKTIPSTGTYSPCVPDCACSLNIYSNETCSNGCSGTCQGIKTIPSAEGTLTSTSTCKFYEESKDGACSIGTVWIILLIIGLYYGYNYAKKERWL